MKDDLINYYLKRFDDGQAVPADFYYAYMGLKPGETQVLELEAAEAPLADENFKIRDNDFRRV